MDDRIYDVTGELDWGKRKLLYVMWKEFRKQVEGYKTDWRVHDYETIKTAPMWSAWIWVTRRYGTRLHLADIAHCSESLYDALNSRDAKFYWFQIGNVLNRFQGIAPLRALLICGVIDKAWIDMKFDYIAYKGRRRVA